MQYLIAEAIAAAETAQPAISASESIRPAMPVRHDVQQILAALETDFEKQRQYLNTLHDTGRLHIDQLSDGDIKAMIQALLVHNPESMGEEHEPFVTAMETYARGLPIMRCIISGFLQHCFPAWTLIWKLLR